MDLTIRLKRHPDESASITCTRTDGTVTWQRQRGQLGAVFPPHDLTHFAVETTLGYSHAFYGLLADGWEIADFAKPWPRGPIPLEALEVELIVGVFDADRRNLTRWNADEFEAHAISYVAARAAMKHEAIAQPRALTQEQIDAVRATRDALLRRWSELAPGEEMVLEFTRR